MTRPLPRIEARLVRELNAGWTLLPSQCVPAPTRTPEQRLLAAVFEEALALLALYHRVTPTPKLERAFVETVEWFQAEDEDYFGFCGLCAVFGWSPEAIRRALWAQGLLQEVPMRRERPAEIHLTGRIGKVTITCAECGTSFQRQASHVARGLSYCTMACRRKGWTTAGGRDGEARASAGRGGAGRVD